MLLGGSPIVIVAIGVVHHARRRCLPLLVGGLSCVGVTSSMVGWSASGFWEGFHLVSALELVALLPLLMIAELWYLIWGALAKPLVRWYVVSLVGGLVGLWAAWCTIGKGIP